MKIIRAKELTKLIGLSRTTLWRLEKAGKFPKRKRISPNAVGWLESDVKDWFNNIFDKQLKEKTNDYSSKTI